MLDEEMPIEYYEEIWWFFSKPDSTRFARLISKILSYSIDFTLSYRYKKIWIGKWEEYYNDSYKRVMIPLLHVDFLYFHSFL